MKLFFFNQVNIITVAKVGSANFLHCNYSQTQNIKHNHSLLRLQSVLNNESNCLIIIGIRNPIDRNLSYLFQTFNDNFYNDVKTKKNNYKGEYCYISELSRDITSIYNNNNSINNLSTKKIIDIYFNQKYHNTFNDWFEEFLEITKIDNFDKEKGVDFYNFPNNNTIMIYTLEKLSENEKYICEKLGITNFINRNNSEKRNYKNIYKVVKDTIVYTKEYLDNLLNTDIMRLFYDDDTIKEFYTNFKTSN